MFGGAQIGAGMDDASSGMRVGTESPAREIRTARLILTPVTPADVDEVFRVYSSPETWLHLPGGIHRDREQTTKLVSDAQHSLVTAGLGPWAVRIRTGVPGSPLHAGAFIGVGGLQMTPAGVWNLGYRLAPESWSRGFALEIAHAAVNAGAGIAASTPITARILANNPASATVATRAGLSLLWEGRPSGATLAASDRPDDLRSQVYSDRPLSESALGWLAAHS
jgi:RimJ/RimL family protein N-acetyltransferase